MKYRKKPIIVEAEQFFEDKKPWPEGVKPACGWHKKGEDGNPTHDVWAMDRDKTDVEFLKKNCDFYYFYIETPEGELRVSDGDWIITGVKGERYPVKPDIFEQTYEKVGQT